MNCLGLSTGRSAAATLSAPLRSVDATSGIGDRALDKHEAQLSCASPLESLLVRPGPLDRFEHKDG